MTDSPQSRFRRFGQPDLTPTELLPDLPGGITCTTCEKSCGDSTDEKFRERHSAPKCRLTIGRPQDKAPNNYRCKACGGPGHSARSNTCHMTVAERAEHRKQSGRRGKK